MLPQSGRSPGIRWDSALWDFLPPALSAVTNRPLHIVSGNVGRVTQTVVDGGWRADFAPSVRVQVRPLRTCGGAVDGCGCTSAASLRAFLQLLGHPPDASVDEKMLAESRDEHAAWQARRQERSAAARREDCALNHRVYLVTPTCAWAQG